MIDPARRPRRQTPKKSSSSKPTPATKPTTAPPAPSVEYLSRAHAYAQAVIDGRTPACNWVRLAAERHLRDLAEGQARGLRYDIAAEKRAISFFEDYLHHSKGKFARQRFLLSDWQCFIVGSVFAWKKADGTRRFSVAYVEVPRKNGKSTLAAGIALYMLIADGEEGAEVYAAATKRDQARIVWNEAARMVRASPALSKRIRVLAGNMHSQRLQSKFEPVGSDSENLDGLNIHCAVVDELHAHKSRDLWDVLDTATGARDQPLMLAITTAGKSRKTICWEKHEYCQQVLRGAQPDDGFFGIIYTLDDGDAWDDPATWAKANPNLGISCNIGQIERKLANARGSSASLNAFRRLHLNQWIEASDNPLFDADALRACQRPFDIEALRGRACFGGLDLASTTDLAAFALVFPPAEEGEPWKALVWQFLPRANLSRRMDRDGVPYNVWAEKGWITLTEGNVIDYGAIRALIRSLPERFAIKEIAFDRWNSTHLITELMEDGCPMVAMGQGFASMAGPTRELVGLVTGGNFSFGENEVVLWQGQNVVAQEDPAGNLKPAKDLSKEKIDGIVAILMGLGRAIAPRDPAPGPLVYRPGEMFG